jgi:hypothetical protein
MGSVCKRCWWSLAATVCAVLFGTMALTGCGVSLAPPYPNRLVGAAGQTFTVEDLAAIASNPDLDDAGKRAAFRALGIEDEKLIDALLNL